MTDMSKYKNVSLSKETYKVLESLSKVILPDAKLSVAKTIEAIAKIFLVQTIWCQDNFKHQKRNYFTQKPMLDQLEPLADFQGKQKCPTKQNS